MKDFILAGPERAIRNAWRSLRRWRNSSCGYNVLGISSTGHGASFALASSAHGVRALNLDRFLRKKYAVLLSQAEHDEIRAGKTNFGKTTRYLLSEGVHDLPPISVFETAWRSFLDALLRGTGLGPGDIDLVVASESHFAVNCFQLGRKLGRYFPNAEIVTNIEHHAIHRFQAFLSSPFDEAAVLTLDNCGEPLGRLGGSPLAITLSSVQNAAFAIHREHTFPESSPGLLYHWFTNYLGFRSGEEGKTMGLSSYGRDSCYRALSPHLEMHDNGAFRFLGHKELQATLSDLGAKPRRPGTSIEPIHGDVARAGQMLLDNIVTNAVTALARLTPSRNLCLAGGVALNSVSNERAFRRSRFQNLYVMPNAGDCGQALGCALYGAHVLRRDRKSRGLLSDSLGPPYTDSEVVAALRAANLEPVVCPDIAASVAGLLAAGFVVGWFQGGSEYGPRALGRRSILADPRPQPMKDYLNCHVKHRESFRPYAPAVLEDKSAEWFDLKGTSPYMLRVVDVRPEKRSTLAAVTHVDGTARVQTVSRYENPLFYDLIRKFENRTGVPVVLNTSFNRAGEPIVETPADAIECFMSTRIDALAIHNFLITKST